MTAFHLLSDAELAESTVTPAQLQAAIAVVAAMSNREFIAACETVGRPVHLSPRPSRDYHWRTQP